MSSDLATIDLQTAWAETDVSTSGAWSERFGKRPEMHWVRRLPVAAEILLTIAASPATAIPDYWFFERRRGEACTAAWMLEEAIGRPISRSEALRIAAQVLEEAERERLECAGWEAKQGIQWGAGE